MKGLLIKDVKMIMKNRATLLCMIAIVSILMMVTETGNSFLIGYVVMLCTMFVITTIGQDDYNNTISFLMTLPVTRRSYVGEKYLLMFLCALTGLILGAGGCVLRSSRLDGVFFAQAAAVFMVLMIFQLIMVPLQLKFGGEKSRIVLFLMFAALSGSIIAVEKLTERASFSRTGAAQVLNRVLTWILSQSAVTLAALGTALVLLCTAISMAVSTRIMNRREF